MAFLYNIPQSTDQLSISQGNLLNNMGILGAIAGNATANSASLNPTVGFNFTNFALQSNAPATGANQMALYTYTNPNTTKQELYIQRQSTAAGVPATPASIPMTAAAVSGNRGWTYLPSGALMIWGQSAIVGGGTAILFNNAGSGGINSFPGFTLNSSLNITIGVNSSPSLPLSGIYLSAFTPTGSSGGFTAVSNQTYTFFWSAVGI